MNLAYILIFAFVAYVAVITFGPLRGGAIMGAIFLIMPFSPGLFRR